MRGDFLDTKLDEGVQATNSSCFYLGCGALWFVPATVGLAVDGIRRILAHEQMTSPH